MRGPASAPPLIREAFHCDSTNLWSETGVDFGEGSPIFDAGDLTFRQDDDAFTHIEEAITLLLGHRLIPISLGGDHSITYPIIKAFHEKYDKLQILHFDAHADLRDGYDGEHYSHASALRRCLDNEKLELVSVGIRNISAEEIPFLEANRHPNINQ